MSNLPGAAPMGPFDLMFWTIAVEFQFYLIFPFLLRFIRQGGWRYAGALIALALVMRVPLRAHGADAPPLVVLVARWPDRSIRPRHPSRAPLSPVDFIVSPHGILTLAACTIAAIGMLFAFHLAGGNPLVATWKIALAHARSRRLGALYRCISRHRRLNPATSVVDGSARSGH